jgi:hypothetical protein
MSLGLTQPWKKQMIKKYKYYEEIATRERIIELKDKGLLRVDLIGDGNLEEMLANIAANPILITDNPDVVPKRTDGMVICNECHHLYWRTPKHDGYQLTDKPGIYCYGCMHVVYSGMW